MPSPFRVLELIPELVTFPFDWELDTDGLYSAFKTLCLRPSSYEPLSYPCPRECGCWHRIIHRHDGNGAIGACQCDPPTNCPDFTLTTDQITPLEVNRPKLGRALCRALGLDSKPADLAPAYTMQIGSWSSEAVPVILTVQSDQPAFHGAVTELVARLRRPFILISPTASHLTAGTQEILTSAGAALVTMESAVTLLPDGTLQAKRPPAEIFAQFTAPERSAGGFAPPPSSIIHHPPSIIAPQRSHAPRYALRKGLGVWDLTFGGEGAGIRHERGVFYAAWLFYHPAETPLHALDLVAKVPEMYRQQLGLPVLRDAGTGRSVVLESHARLQERSLALDDAQAMRALLRKQRELEEVLDSKTEIEPAKQEALRSLEQIYAFQREHGRRSRDGAWRAAHAVRSAITRLQRRLAAAVGQDGAPHAVLRAFAEHIDKHILVPSVRYSGHGGRHARAGLGGCFTYERPGGVWWSG